MSILTRREFAKGVAVGAAFGQAQGAAAAMPVSVFSKHLHWLGWKEMGAAAKEVGFDAIDLTVRKGGHVLPERVAEDLPKAASAIEHSGLRISMLTTDIADVSTPHCETVLRTAAGLDIKHYRWGGFRYRPDTPLAAQLDQLKPKVKELAALNRELGMCAMYHTHSGVNQVGASMWDLWLLLKDHDPDQVSFNYDIGHATVEGGLGGWVHSARLAAPLMRGIAIKDFRWEKTERGWRVKWCALGEGMVQLGAFFKMIRAANFTGPLQIHYEYDLGGADKGAQKISMKPTEVLAAMKKDLATVRSLL